LPSSIFQTECADVLYRKFPIAEIKENYRPEWLTTGIGQRLELDFFLPQVHVGIEIQGKQHAVFVKRFHTDAAGYEAQKERDSAKRILCEEHGVKLFEVWNLQDMDFVISHIASRCLELERQGVRLLQLKHLASNHREAVFRMYRRRIARLDKKIAEIEARGKKANNDIGRRDRYMRRLKEHEDILIGKITEWANQVQDGKPPTTAGAGKVLVWHEDGL